MIRATTGGVLRSYRSNLMNSFITQNKAFNTVLSQRNFNSYAEDPASAAKAFRLRKSRMITQSQYNICNDTYSKYQTAWDCLETISLELDNDSGEFMKTIAGTDLTWLNDPTGDAREQLTKVLDQMSEALIQNLNQTYGGNFIFAGADGHNVPFEIKDNKLYYRGVSVDAQAPNILQSRDGRPVCVDANGQIDMTDPFGDNLAAGAPVNYLKMDNVTVMSQADYTKLITPPSVDMNTTQVPGVTTPQRYDKNGNAIADSDPDPDTVYYKRTGTGELITSSQYNEELYTANHPPQQVMAAGGGAAVTVDRNGVPDPAGTYCLVVDGDIETISKDVYDEEKLEADKLEYLANEKLFVDIGLGFQENEKGELIQSSAFNAALIGIDFIGYGLDEDGDPKNIYSLVQRLKELSASVPEGGNWKDVWPEFNRLVGKLETSANDFHTAFTNMDAGTTKLKTNVKLLENNFYNLQDQYAELEDVDMADAITSFIWAQYCYNAALKVGNSVLSQSLMDYLS